MPLRGYTIGIDDNEAWVDVKRKFGHSLSLQVGQKILPCIFLDASVNPIIGPYFHDPSRMQSKRAEISSRARLFQKLIRFLPRFR